MDEWWPILSNAAWLLPVFLVTAYLLTKYVFPNAIKEAKIRDGCSSIGTARTGDRFVLPKEWIIRALDDLVLQLPGTLLADDEQIGDIICGHDNMEVRIETDLRTGQATAIFLRLVGGQELSLSRSSEAVIHAGDRTIRIEIVSRGEPYTNIE